MTQNKEYTTFGKQVGYVISGNVVSLLLGIVWVPLLTKGLGAGLFGTWSLINVTVSLLAPFAMLSFSTSIVRFLSAENDPDKVRDDFFSACSLVFISSSLFSLVMFFLSNYLAVSIFKDSGSSAYIRLGSALILFSSLYPVVLAYLRMRRKMGLYTILNLSQEALQIGLAVAALLLGYKLGGVITAFIAGSVLVTVIALFYIIRETGFRLPGFHHMKEYLKWGVPLTPNGAILWIINVSDRYFVSYFLGVTAAGVYSAGYAIGQYASFALMPLGMVLYPTISKTYDEGNLIETGRYLSYSLKYLLMIAIPAACGLSMLSKTILRILTTSEFVIGSNVIPWVAFGAVLFCFYQICAYVIHLVSKTQITVWLLGTSAILNIGLNLVLIPRIGIVGAAVATFIAYGVLGLLTLLITRRYLKFNLNWPFIGKSVLASGLMSLFLWFINPGSVVMLVVSIVSGIIIYFGALLLLRSFSSQEIGFFTTFVRDNTRKIFMLK